ncbi:MAG TPA: ABC transporter permease [Burkholderiaceae bacterium]|nr:ABC transporter permease [Burkholderiaceae bacterium]
MARVWQFLFGALCALVLVFLLLPILAIVPLSFSSGSLLVYPLPGLSLRWYAEVFTSPVWMRGVGNSLLIGVAATLLAVALGTLAALGLARQRGAGAAALKMLMLSPMIVPVILIAVASYFFLAPLNLVNTYLGLVATHTVIAVPFVVIPVLTALELMDPNLLRAAAACGAGPAQAFFRVTLPAIRPAVASGALFAFAASFDDVVIALLLAGAHQRTLPQEMFSGLRDTITPAMLAVATLMIALSTLLFVGVQRVQRQARSRAALPR